MNGGETAVVIRPRNFWQSIDLGFVMARHWWPPLMFLWCIPVLPVTAAGYLAFGYVSWAQGFLLWLFVWWMKPLYEWPLIDFLSRAAFDNRASVSQSFGVYKPAKLKQVLPYILWRRFSLQRGLSMTVCLLEGLSGDAQRQRIAVLNKGLSGLPWLLIICMHFEWIISLGFYMALIFFSASEYQSQDVLQQLIQYSETLPGLDLFIMLLAWGLVAPFFIAASFAAYLGRRTTLEAWDLELVFKSMGERWRARSMLSAFVLMLALGGVGVPTEALYADTGQTQSDEADMQNAYFVITQSDDAKQLINDVLADDTFGRPVQRTTWRYRGSIEQNKAEKGWALDSLISGWLGQLLLLVLWLILFAALMWLIWYIANAMQWLQPESSREDDVSTSLPTEQQSIELPADVPSVVARYLDGQHYREALALLFKASLDRISAQSGEAVPEGATETECRAWVSRLGNKAQVEYFQQLINWWIRVAYGGQNNQRLLERDDADLWRLQQTWINCFQGVD